MKKVIIIMLLVNFLFAQDTSNNLTELINSQQINSNYIWTLIAAFMVFFMQAGFAMLETGLTRAKNAVNIIMKNLMDFSIGALSFWLVGFGLMFGVSYYGFFGTSGFAFSDFQINNDPWVYAFWMFQVVFAATAATIVSGAVAERTKFVSYLLISVIITAFIYPIFGSWAWGSLYQGSGWLEKLGFIDFAGSTVVHSIGGWAALAGALILGPRAGKFDKKGNPKPMPGHNLNLAALGTFILWFGWFGFNAGSTTTANTDIALIAVNTTLSGAAGVLSAMLASWATLKKPDASMSLNGAIAGLVGITAGCANVSPAASVLIGLASGIIVVFSVLFIEKKLKIDDPVGAISVHGVCGAWGTIAVGIFNVNGFSLNHILIQFIGVAAAFIWAFPVSYLLFKLVDIVIGLRVKPEEEFYGLDISEHGMEAYPEFDYYNPISTIPEENYKAKINPSFSKIANQTR